MKMLEIFERVIKKRLLHKGHSTSIESIACTKYLIQFDLVDFRLEKKDTPGEVIDLNQSLEAIGVDEFLLTRVDAS